MPPRPRRRPRPGRRDTATRTAAAEAGPPPAARCTPLPRRARTRRRTASCPCRERRPCRAGTPGARRRRPPAPRMPTTSSARSGGLARNVADERVVRRRGRRTGGPEGSPRAARPSACERAISSPVTGSGRRMAALPAGRVGRGVASTNPRLVVVLRIPSVSSGRPGTRPRRSASGSLAAVPRSPPHRLYGPDTPRNAVRARGLPPRRRRPVVARAGSISPAPGDRDVALHRVGRGHRLLEARLSHAVEHLRTSANRNAVAAVATKSAAAKSGSERSLRRATTKGARVARRFIASPPHGAPARAPAA